MRFSARACTATVFFLFELRPCDRRYIPGKRVSMNGPQGREAGSLGEATGSEGRRRERGGGAQETERLAQGAAGC